MSDRDEFLNSICLEELSQETKEILESLTSREIKVLRERFGIDKITQQSLDEAFKDFDITEERIREIEEKALRKLRKKKDGKNNDDV